MIYIVVCCIMNSLWTTHGANMGWSQYHSTNCAWDGLYAFWALTSLVYTICVCVCGLVMCCQYVCLSQDTCSDYDRIRPLVGALVGVRVCVCACVLVSARMLSLTDVPCLSAHLIRLWGGKNVLVSTHPHLGCYAAACHCYCKSASAKVNSSALSCLKDS